MSLPPPYSSYASTSGSSSSSRSRKSSDKKRNHRTDSSHHPDMDNADLRSIASGHSGSSARTQLSSRSDTLKLAIRTDVADRKHAKGIRRARCSPEFLEEIAKAGVPHGFKTRAESTFKVVSGLEAEGFFEQFIGELGHAANEKALREYARQNLSRPVVFAFSLVHAGRRVVDYYMTWRGKIPRVRDRRDHRRSFLDSEFRRVARSLDRHYKSIISVVDNSTPISDPARLPDASKRPEEPPKPLVQEEEPPRSPDAVSATDSVVSLPLLNMIRNVPFGNRQTLRVTNPDTASILSDASADGRETPVPSAPRILETIAEATETATVAPLTESISVPEPSQPGQADVGKSPKSRHRASSIKERRKNHSEGSRTTPDREKKSPSAGDERKHSSHRHEERKHCRDEDDHEKRRSGTGDERKHSSHRREERKHHRDDDDAEKRSPGTGDERKHSSHRREERKHHRDEDDPEKRSPGTGDDQKHSSHRREERKHRNEDDTAKKSPSAGDERKHSSHRHEEHKHGSEDASHKRSSKRHHHDNDGDRDRDKENDKHKHRNEESDSDVASEFTIVLLNDLAEKDLLSWHGLNRTDVNATPRSTITINDSPWTGPLVNATKIIFHTPQSRHGQVEEPPFTDDDESDESDPDYEYDWHDNSPVIPHIFTEGPRHFASPAPPIVPLSFPMPSAPSYSASNAATPLARSTSLRPTSAASYRTAYIYPTHGVHQSPSASSYVPAWIDPRHYDTPLTMMQTPLSYTTASPF